MRATMVQGRRRPQRHAEVHMYNSFLLSAPDTNGGEDQVAFLDGEEVPYDSSGAYRPSFLVRKEGLQEAFDVFTYNLLDKDNIDSFLKEIKRKILVGDKNLPQDIAQHIILNVSEAASETLIQYITSTIQSENQSLSNRFTLEVVKGFL